MMYGGAYYDHRTRNERTWFIISKWGIIESEDSAKDCTCMAKFTDEHHIMGNKVAANGIVAFLLNVFNMFIHKKQLVDY